MPIDMSNYKMIYKDQVFNVLGIMINCRVNFQENLEKKGLDKPKFIEATYLDENGEVAIVRDEAFMFKFVRR